MLVDDIKLKLKNLISEEEKIPFEVHRYCAEKLKYLLEFININENLEDKGEISDGYHTFNELYQYRMLYNAAFFNELAYKRENGTFDVDYDVHKSKKHSDGEECFGGGWFIVMAELPTGQISNHYELKYWDLFEIPEKEVANKWDGHSPQEAAQRLEDYLNKKVL